MDIPAFLLPWILIVSLDRSLSVRSGGKACRDVCEAMVTLLIIWRDLLRCSDYSHVFVIMFELRLIVPKVKLRICKYIVTHDT